MTAIADVVTSPPGAGKSIVFGPGERYLFRLTGAETGGRYEVFEAMVEPGAGPPEHVHRQRDESFYVLDGTFAVTVGGVTLQLGTGGVIHIPRGAAHTYRNSGDRCGLLLVTCTPAGIEPLLDELSAYSWEPPDPDVLLPILAKYDIEVVGPLPTETT